MIRLALLVLATTTVAACAQQKDPYETVLIPQEISQGDTLVLLKPLEVPSGRNAIYFQGGRVVEENGINSDAPYCRLELNGPTRTKLTIKPQHFEITKVTYDDQAQGGHADEQISTTYFALRSGKGGETERIACGRPGKSAQPNFPTAGEIGAALDGYFSIEVPY